ncbi:uncharacterized protein [Coffea arabica]|uniref:Uncharacterized protein n=1 Tax=Coffea arabica TaxID=13443 RepID=A0A6P6WFE2_COFAR|nr:uncharacterized protein LOC113731508 [Coffea arabica]
MVANHHFTRMDTLELKDLIYRKIGHQRAEKYFNQLRRLFSLQLSKIEFDNVCIRTIGRENISLHNRLIRSIIMNASIGKVPPPKAKKINGSLGIKVANGYQRTCLQSLYGEAFAQSPRKSRSPVHRDRKFRDHPSPLGPLGKSPNCEEGALRVQEQQSATELISLGSRPPVEVASVEEGEEVEQIAGSPSIQSRSPVTAPFGISMNLGGARKGPYVGGASADYICARNFQSSGGLPDTESLRTILKKRLELEGVGISLDCANLLNNGLDVFLKRLIEPCMLIARTHCPKEHVRHSSNHLLPGSNGILPAVFSERPSTAICASVLDFRVAMESNPRMLGEDWPLQLEKIASCAFES